MKPTVCGEEIPDWFYQELLIRFGEPVNMNHVFRVLLDDYLKRNTPKTHCKDCGVETTPGVGSARCGECWDDKCGEPST